MLNIVEKKLSRFSDKNLILRMKECFSARDKILINAIKRPYDRNIKSRKRNREEGLRGRGVQIEKKDTQNGSEICLNT